MASRRWFAVAVAVAVAVALAMIAPAAEAAKPPKLPPGIVTFAVKKSGRVFLAGVTSGGSTCNFASGDITSFAWSGDGTRLLLSRVDHQSPRTANLYFTKNFGSSANSRIPIMTDHGTDGTIDRLPSWSPSRGAISFTRATGPVDHRQSAIYWMHNDATGLRALTHPPLVGGVQTTDYWSSFSPDGNFVAFVRERGVGLSDLGAVGPDGTEQMLTTDGQDARHGYDWAPTGHRIVFVRDSGQAASDLWIVDAFTDRERRLTSDGKPKFAPRWSPDGRHIVFEERDGNEVRAVEIDASGGSRRTLAKPHGRVIDPVWATDSRFVAYYVGR